MHTASPPTILLVHPDAPARLALASPLRAYGWQVFEADTLDAALQISRDACPTVALIEHATNREICLQLRAARYPQKIHCALITSVPPDLHAPDDLVDLWLLRPFTEHQLLAQMRFLMRLATLEQAPAQSLPLPYEEIIETTMDGFWVIRARDQRFIMVNDAYCQLSGYSREELLNLHIKDIDADEHADEVMQRIRRIMTLGKLRFESRHRRKDGTIFYVEISVRQVILDEPLMVVFARDITQRKQIEENLRRSEHRYRTLLNAIPDRVFRQDSQGVFLDYHVPSDLPLLLAPQEFIGRSYRDVLPPVISEPFALALERATQSGQSERFEYDLPDPDGTIHCFESRVIMADDGDVITIVRDITEQREAERRLQEQHEQFLTIFDAFPAILYVSDPFTHEVLFVNKVFQELLGYDPLGQKCYCAFQGLTEPCPFCTNDTILKTRQPHVWEYHNSLMKIDLLITDQIIRWPDGRDVRFELAINITEVKQVERAYEALSRELARKNRELEQIVYVTSHDLRSPLVNVQGFSRELQASLDDLIQQVITLPMSDAQRAAINVLIEEEIPESLHYILNGVSRMDTLLKGLLRLSRLGRSALTIETLDIQRMVKEILTALDFELKQAVVTVDLQPLPPCRGDAMQVSQVFANLISNALKYLDPQRPGQITIRATRSKGMVIYTVADNGIGLAPEHQEKVFELYYRLDPTHTEGEGLGLTIVRTIVDRHGGWVGVESTLGVGSQFFVALPEAS